jgi:hypothetical protein
MNEILQKRGLKAEELAWDKDLYEKHYAGSGMWNIPDTGDELGFFGGYESGPWTCGFLVEHVCENRSINEAKKYVAEYIREKFDIEITAEQVIFDTFEVHDG